MTENRTPSIAYKYNDEADKHYFAGILNTAQLNFTRSFNELGRRLSISGTPKEIIKKAFAESVAESDFVYAVECLSETLRVVKLLPTKKRRDFINTLLLFEGTLDKLRNYYTHFYHEAFVPETALFDLLDNLLRKAIATVERVRLTDSETNASAFLPKSILEKLTGFTEQQKTKLFTQAIEQFFDADGELTEYFVSKGEYGKFSEKGFILFVCLFLSRREQEDLFAHTTGFKGTHELAFLVTRWVYSQYPFRNITKRFRSDFEADALFLQLIEELNKAPKEVFDFLSEEDKQEFIEDTNSYLNERDNSLVEHFVIRKRYEDKFPYFALRFLDEFANFPTLRFQVKLGTYVHDNRTKTVAGKETTRILKEPIKVFEKLNDINKLKRDALAVNDGADTNALGWQRFPNPHYNLQSTESRQGKVNNNIPIWLNIPAHFQTEKKNEERTKRPEKERLLQELFNDDVNVKQPIALLSLNELPAILYKLLVEKDKGAEIEKVLFEHIKKQINLVRSGSNNPKDKLPKRLKFLLDGKSGINKSKVEKSISYEIEITENYLDQLDEYEKGERLTNKDRGEFATWLADDIKRFANPTERKELKGYQHSELQTLLSFYNTRKKDVIRLLKEIDLISSNRFLRAALREKKLDGFFRTYLKERLTKLRQLQRAVVNSIEIEAKVIEELSAIFGNQVVNFPNENYKEELLSKPLNLQRGIFDDAPTAVDKSLKTDEKSFAKWFNYGNNHNGFQLYYSYKRHYENGLTLDPTIPGLLEQNQGERVPFSVLKNEQQVRRIKRSDVYTIEMAKFILNGIITSETFEELTLKDVYLTKHQREEQRTNALLPENRKEDHILSKEITAGILNGKVRGKVALKDIGKFRNLESNELVKALISYDDARVWSPEELQKELEEYEDIRKNQFFKKIHELENSILLKAQREFNLEEHPRVLEQKGNPNFKSYIAYGFLPEEKRVNFQEINFSTLPDNHITNFNATSKRLALLIVLRNKFSHNQLPSTTLYHIASQIKEKQVEDSYASYFLKLVEDLTKPFM